MMVFLTQEIPSFANSVFVDAHSALGLSGFKNLEG